MNGVMIQLWPLSAEEFEVYSTEAIQSYAADKKKGEGLTQAEADRIATESFTTLLPQGVDTPASFLFSVVEVLSQKKIGTLWIGVKGDAPNQKAFIYDIFFETQSRGRGYGRQTMHLAEAKARELGFKKIALHVFGHNLVARKLYEKLGYQVTNVSMAKELC